MTCHLPRRDPSQRTAHHPQTETPMKEELGSAVIVGAGPGLGAALARRAAREGLTVFMSARNEARLQTLAKEIGGRAVACDATREADVGKLFGQVAESHGAP